MLAFHFLINDLLHHSVIPDNFLEHHSMGNRNNVTEFILLGLSKNKEAQILCFLFFLLCYLALWLGNLLIMGSITRSQLINQPMYFFLNYLALSDLLYTSTVTPKLMTDLLNERKVVSYKNCMTQLFPTHFFGGIEVFNLTGMAYDRYVAVCQPLHYAVIMSRQRCKLPSHGTSCRGVSAFPWPVSPDDLSTLLWPQ
ncbi:Olfactory receptor 4P4 [Camelus dromedarius]|uniref:Olfactory receptor 4P4 n=1 Tax=Camelus dromedarius TaxID=9838 RepID=A0A5N4DMV2_CAMDR|nr:Olfactory receptor 4P4 [Camelus dromedarius]